MRKREGEAVWDREYESHRSHTLRWIKFYRLWHLVEWTDECVSTNKQPSGYYRPPRTYLRHCVCGVENKVDDEDVFEFRRLPEEGTICELCMMYYRGLIYQPKKVKVGKKHRDAAKNKEACWYDF